MARMRPRRRILQSSLKARFCILLVLKRTSTDVPKGWREAEPPHIAIVGFGAPPIVNNLGFYILLIKLLHNFDSLDGMFPCALIRVNELVHLILTVSATKGVDAGRIGAHQLMAPTGLIGFEKTAREKLIFLLVSKIDLADL
jgi:hypothetical protein